ncbi:KR domain-containing protein [Chaetomium fimeti]|uniref:KR domain-containing protein n=1 Tax=Chaetomium fimeti TaxID=1854472 RepID=A0AAE0HAI5_9PEZI|nr:KR domain-containing protein [Chaetomium fimeti]
MVVNITNLASLRAAVTAIGADMPPIGGVMNGAMLPRDRLFQNMPWVDFAAVLAPKVAESRNLDAVLYEDEKKEPLAFFICLSSITSIAGNVGQSAYASWPRRSLRTRYHNQAEPDLHAMMAEAVVGGRDSDGDSDGDSSHSTASGKLITGLRTVFEGEKQRPQNPHLALYLRDDGGDDLDTRGERGAAAMSVQAQLTEVGADNDAGQQRAMLKKAFAIALGRLLEIDPATIDPVADTVGYSRTSSKVVRREPLQDGEVALAEAKQWTVGAM